MSIQNTREIKDKIISLLKERGPLLPTHISEEIGMDTIFTSAFLSELISEKAIRASYMRIGSSPVYFLDNQREQLEKYQEHIKGKEKEALMLLKEKHFLKDENQEPPIRVALRQLKDFATPFEKEGKIFWRYFNTEKKEIEEKPKEEIKPKETEKSIENLEKKKTSKLTKKPRTQRKKSTTASQKKSEKFFNKVKEFLSKNEIEILDIEGITKDYLTLKIREKETQKILVAFNKKRLTESDFLKANKKAEEMNLRYIVLSLGEPAKKITNFIEAIKNLSEVSKIE